MTLRSLGQVSKKSESQQLLVLRVRGDAGSFLCRQNLAVVSTNRAELFPEGEGWLISWGLRAVKWQREKHWTRLTLFSVFVYAGRRAGSCLTLALFRH